MPFKTRILLAEFLSPHRNLLQEHPCFDPSPCSSWRLSARPQRAPKATCPSNPGAREGPSRSDERGSRHRLRRHRPPSRHQAGARQEDRSQRLRSDLNQASIAIGDLTGQQTVTRRVTNVDRGLLSYQSAEIGRTAVRVEVP
jgi:hypothetical protein